MECVRIQYAIIMIICSFLNPILNLYSDQLKLWDSSHTFWFKKIVILFPIISNVYLIMRKIIYSEMVSSLFHELISNNINSVINYEIILI